jgi:glyoxylase-like metal-dependent hydrolase (beta-lactamase superfamily II)
MKTVLASLTGLLLSAPLGAQTGDAGGLFTIEFRKVADGIYLAYRPDVLRFWVEGNSTILINDRDVVVVDGSGTRETAVKVIAEIKRLTPKPVRYLVNTHGHGDHTLGNQEYVRVYPGVEIVAHPETREYLTGTGISYVAAIAKSTESRKANFREEIARVEKEARPGREAILANLHQYLEHDLDIRQTVYRRVTVTPPTLLVDHELVLKRGARTIEIRFIGKGDTPGDLIVNLPVERIVITGDMVVHPVPYGYSADPLAWRATLDRLAAIDFDRMIPGHGEVREGKAYLHQLTGTMDTLVAAVKRGVAAGKRDSTIRAELDAVALGRPYAGTNPVYQYYFEQYFLDPMVGTLFKQEK